MTHAIDVAELTHSYPPSRRKEAPRIALHDLSFHVDEGEVFGLLGPNGSGKSTLFRILATLLRPAHGSAQIYGFNVADRAHEIRQLIGVVFQNPSLDTKLTVAENLLHQGHLYNLHGTALKNRMREMLSLVGVTERAHDLVERLSGGLQRRVELAKGMLHQPRVLLLDEPSTGLDPGARKEFDDYLLRLRNENGTSIFLTTHILDEAEQCDRIAILDKGQLVALGTPLELKREIGGDVISVATPEPTTLCDMIRQKFGGEPRVVDGTIRIERANGHEFVPQLVEAFLGQIDAIAVSKPTLEDVFIHKTGHRFWDGERVFGKSP